MDDIIRKAYYNPEEGYVGIDKLYRKLKSKGVTREDITSFLKRQEVYQVNKKNNRKPSSFIPRYPLQEFQIDLIYLENKHLNDASYGLCSIDAFTKKGDIELMKKKTKQATVDAMLEILDRMGIPKMLYCDEGSEFNNAPFKKMCKDLEIELIFTIKHAPIVERFNRTIKEMMEKYLQSTSSKTITRVLPKLLKNYNNSYHSTIGMAPNDVKEDNMHIVQINLFKRLNTPSLKSLKVGDRVRVEIKPKSFVKGYKPKFSKKIYEVTEDGKGYYKTSKDDRKYFRSNLQKVDANELNLEKPDIEGTREEHIKGLSKRPKPEYILPEPEPRARRGRKPISYQELPDDADIIYEI